MTEKLRTLVSEAEIALRVRELAVEIRAAYEGEEFTALGVIDDSFVFMSDLIRAINIPLTCAFIHATLRDDGGHTGIFYTSDIDPTGRHVLLVAGICDTAVTIDYIARQVGDRGAKTLRTCVLVDKPDYRTTEFTPDFVGFKRSEERIFGYGLGLGDSYRYLPHLAVRESSES